MRYVSILAYIHLVFTMSGVADNSIRIKVLSMHGIDPHPRWFVQVVGRRRFARLRYLQGPSRTM